VAPVGLLARRGDLVQLAALNDRIFVQVADSAPWTRNRSTRPSMRCLRASRDGKYCSRMRVAAMKRRFFIASLPGS